MSTRTQTFFLSWIGFCIMTHIDLQTIHLTHGMEMIKLAGEQFDLTVKFTVIFLILAIASWLFDTFNK